MEDNAKMINYSHMTKILELAIQQAKSLPEDRQNTLGGLIISLVRNEKSLPTIYLE